MRTTVALLGGRFRSRGPVFPISKSFLIRRLPDASSYWVPGRVAFSQSLSSYAPNHSSDESHGAHSVQLEEVRARGRRQPATDPKLNRERMVRRDEQRQQRLADDADRRKAKSEQRETWLRRKTEEDSEWLTARITSNKRWKRLKYAQDANYRALCAHQTLICRRLQHCTDLVYRERLRNSLHDPALVSELDSTINAELDAAYLQAKRETDKARRSDPLKERKRRLRDWVTRNARVRELTWKTHTPVLYPNKVKHRCTGCGYETRRGLVFWWRRNDNPDLYDCHSCFASDWSRALPLGYEHIEFGEHVTAIIRCKRTQTKREKGVREQH